MVFNNIYQPHKKMASDNAHFSDVVICLAGLGLALTQRYIDKNQNDQRRGRRPGASQHYSEHG